MGTRDLRRRLEKLESEELDLDLREVVDVDPVNTATEEEWRALAILAHELEHPPGAEIDDATWAELERRLAVGSPS